MEVSPSGQDIAENLGGIALRGGLGQKYLAKEPRSESTVNGEPSSDLPVPCTPKASLGI